MKVKKKTKKTKTGGCRPVAPVDVYGWLCQARGLASDLRMRADGKQLNPAEAARFGDWIVDSVEEALCLLGFYKA